MSMFALGDNELNMQDDKLILLEVARFAGRLGGVMQMD